MGNKQVKKAIDLAEKTHTLTLSDDSWRKTLPARVLELIKLRTLNLDSTGFVQCPPSGLCALVALRTLSMRGCRITSLTSELAQLQGLERLVLCNNKLTSVPPEVWRLPKLKLLDLQGNQLTVLWEGGEGSGDGDKMGDKGGSTVWAPKLQAINVSNNKLTSLCSPSTTLVPLPALKELNLDNNKLTSLPPELAACSALRILRVVNNALKSIPKQVLAEGQCHSIHLDGNPFCEGNAYYQLPGYDAYLGRRKDGVDKRIQAGLQVELS